MNLGPKGPSPGACPGSESNNCLDIPPRRKGEEHNMTEHAITARAIMHPGTGS